MFGAGAVCLLACLATACELERQDKSGFLRDYSSLGPDPRGTSARVFVKEPNVLGSYDKVLLEPVRIMYRPTSDFWGLSPTELQDTARYFREAAVRALDDRYPVVNEAGPGVLRVRAAITRVRPQISRPPIGANTPATYVHSKLRQSGRRASGLEAAMEAELLDSQTDQVLVAFIDQRAVKTSGPDAEASVATGLLGGVASLFGFTGDEKETPAPARSRERAKPPTRWG